MSAEITRSTKRPSKLGCGSLSTVNRSRNGSPIHDPAVLAGQYGIGRPATRAHPPRTGGGGEGGPLVLRVPRRLRVRPDSQLRRVQSARTMTESIRKRPSIGISAPRRGSTRQRYCCPLSPVSPMRRRGAATRCSHRTGSFRGTWPTQRGSASVSAIRTGADPSSTSGISGSSAQSPGICATPFWTIPLSRSLGPRHRLYLSIEAHAVPIDGFKPG
jgi:hypothetical protein